MIFWYVIAIIWTLMAIIVVAYLTVPPTNESQSRIDRWLELRERESRR